MGRLRHLLWLACCLAQVMGQVNTEAMRMEGLAAGLHGSLGGDFGLNRGNTTLLNLKTNLRLDHRSGWGHNFVVGQIGLVSSGTEEFTNQGFVHIRSVKMLGERYFAEAFLQQQFDRSILLDNRQLAGGGVRIKWLANDSTAFGVLGLTTGFGMMWEREVTDSGQTVGGDPDTRLLRSTNYLVLNWAMADKLALSATTYFQFDLKNFQDYRFLLEGRLRVTLTRRITLVVNLNLRYDSEPPVGVAQPLDLALTNGLAFTL